MVQSRYFVSADAKIKTIKMAHFGNSHNVQFHDVVWRTAEAKLLSSSSFMEAANSSEGLVKVAKL